MTAYTMSITPRAETRSGDSLLSTAAQGQSGAELPLAALSELRQILLDRRASLSEQIAALETKPAQENGESAAPIDAADGRRIAWGRTVSRIAVNTKLSLLREIDQALRRIDDGTYGLDMATGAVIPLERLREIPWARSV